MTIRYEMNKHEIKVAIRNHIMKIIKEEISYESIKITTDKDGDLLVVVESEKLIDEEGE